LGFNAQEAGSIGIIGGADGPTATFLTYSLIFDGPLFKLILSLLVLIISAIGWFITKKK
jgi:Na+-transporting methylmalonyl-CoA/oxaloacetate decarboxylase beta subunit